MWSLDKELFSVNVLFLSLDLSHGMTYLVFYILLLLQTHSNGSLRPIFLVRSLSLQFNFILVYYEVTVYCVGLHFIVIGELQVFIVLYCIVLISKFHSNLVTFSYVVQKLWRLYAVVIMTLLHSYTWHGINCCHTFVCTQYKQLH